MRPLRVISAATMAVTCLATWRAEAAEPVEPVVMARVSVRNPGELATKAAALVGKFDAKQGQQVQHQIKMLLGMGALLHLDLARPVSLVVFSGKGAGRPVDAQDIDAFNLRELPKLAFVLHVTNEENFRAAAQAANPLVGGREVKVRDGCAVIAQDVRTVLAAAGERLDEFRAYPRPAGDSDLCVTAHVRQSIGEYVGDIERLLRAQEPRVAAQFAPMGRQGARMAELIVTLMRCVGPILRLTAAQADSASVQVKLTDDAIDVRARLRAVGGSALHTLFTEHPPLKTDLAKYLPPNAVMGFAGSVDPNRFRPLARAVCDALAEPLKLPRDAQDKMIALMFETGQGSDWAVSIPGGKVKGMQSTQVYRLTDAAKHRRVLKRAMQWHVKEMMGGLMQAMGTRLDLAYTENKRQYKGVAVDHYRITVTNEFMPAPLEPSDGEVAVVGSLAAVTSNSDGEALLNGVIDRIQGDGTPGLDTDAGFRAAQAAAPKGANAIFHVSVQGAIRKFLEQQARQQPPMAVFAQAFKAPPKEDPLCGSVVFAEADDGASMDIVARTPHEPVVGAAKQLYQLWRMMQGEAPPPLVEPVPPKPGGGPDF